MVEGARVSDELKIECQYQGRQNKAICQRFVSRMSHAVEWDRSIEPAANRAGDPRDPQQPRLTAWDEASRQAEGFYEA